METKSSRSISRCASSTAVTAATLTAALGEAYIIILSKIAKGELKMSDLSTKKGQKAMKQEFDKQLKKSKSLVS